MELLNQIDIETRGGARTFELMWGDITRLAEPVDLFVLSVRKQSYYPEQGSVIGALHQDLSIDVGALAEQPDMDFRRALNCWVARSPRSDFCKHFLCIEVYSASSTERAAQTIFSNVFATLAALEAKGYTLHTIAMPLLGTRHGRLSYDLVMRTMLDHSLKALEHSRTLRKVQFILLNEEHALELSYAMDRVLGRTQVRVPRGAAMLAVRRKIASRLETALHLAGTNQTLIFDELRDAILSEESRPYTLGVAARKVVEFIIYDLMARKKFKDINTALKQLEQQDQGPALWILHYMEAIRTLGNNAAHMGLTHPRQPAHPTQADLELLLLCLLRVLDFWIERRRTLQEAATAAQDGAVEATLVDDVVTS